MREGLPQSAPSDRSFLAPRARSVLWSAMLAVVANVCATVVTVVLFTLTITRRA
jgi:hypothetical protein